MLEDFESEFDNSDDNDSTSNQSPKNRKRWFNRKPIKLRQEDLDLLDESDAEWLSELGELPEQLHEDNEFPDDELPTSNNSSQNWEDEDALSHSPPKSNKRSNFKLPVPKFIAKFFSDEDEDDEITDSDKLTETSQWKVIKSADLLENVEPEVVEDIVEEPIREIGKTLKTQIATNEVRRLDLSLRDRLKQLNDELTREAKENEQFEQFRKEEEKRADYTLALKNFLYTTLREHLTVSTREATISIDVAFQPYLSDVMRELELSYYIIEIPRNQDLVNLNPNLPYRFSFRIKSI